MYRGLAVAVVIPAFNEEQSIDRTIADVPDFVDHIVVVDDASGDGTARLARRWSGPAPECGRSPRSALEVICHSRNRGVGAAIVTGYRRALALGLDVAVVMAGDGQMDPDDLPGLLDPICAGHADYCKGNRFLHRDVWRVMPPARLAGNLLLSLATRMTSGYHEIFDSQCGYTAITRSALQRIDLDRVFARYGYPNDFLARLHAAEVRVADVRVRPIYGPSWKSGIKPHMVVYPISFVLLRSWASRLSAETRLRLRRRYLPET